MPVHVDQARHDHSATAINHLRLVRRSRVAIRHGLDLLACNQHTEPVAQAA